MMNIALAPFLSLNRLRKIIVISGLLAVCGVGTVAQSSSGGGDVGSGSTVVVLSGSSAPTRKNWRVNKPSKRTAPTTKKTVNPGSVKTKAAENKKSDNISGEPQENIFLNDEAMLLPLPVWTQAAKDSHASGLVQIDIEVDEKGDVVSAVPRSGSELLHESAQKAALQAKFNAKPNKRKGYLMFCFGDHPDCQ